MPLKFSLEDQRKYMRIPFKEHGRDFNGCDCGGLIGLIYAQELKIKLPDWANYYKSTRIESFYDLKHTIGGFLDQLFIEVNTAIKPYDVIVFNIAGQPVHVGLAINEYYFIHVMNGYTSVRQERLYGASWQKRIDGVFRYAMELNNGQ